MHSTSESQVRIFIQRRTEAFYQHMGGTVSISSPNSNWVSIALAFKGTALSKAACAFADGSAS